MFDCDSGSDARKIGIDGSCRVYRIFRGGWEARGRHFWRGLRNVCVAHRNGRLGNIFELNLGLYCLVNRNAGLELILLINAIIS